MILINIHAGRTYTHRERRIYTLSRLRGGVALLECCCCIHTENAAAQHSAQRETESEGLGVCVIYFTLWRPHKDVAQPTAKILQAAAAVARRRLRNLNCAPYIISPNRTHTHTVRGESSAQKRSARTHTGKQAANGFVGRNAFFALVINFYGLTTRARERKRDQ